MSLVGVAATAVATVGILGVMGFAVGGVRAAMAAKASSVARRFCSLGRRAGLDALLQERSHQQQTFSRGHQGWRVVAAGERKSGPWLLLLLVERLQESRQGDVLRTPCVPPFRPLVAG